MHVAKYQAIVLWRYFFRPRELGRILVHPILFWALVALLFLSIC